MAIAVIGVRPSLGATGTSMTVLRMMPTLNIAGESAGCEEPVERVQHAHQRRSDGYQSEERQHDSRECDRQLEFARYACIVSCEESRERFREDDARHDDCACDDHERVDELIAELPCGCFAALGQSPRKRGDERSTHGPFGEEVAHQVRNAVRDVERVHRVAGAEQVGQNLVTHESKYAD